MLECTAESGPAGAGALSGLRSSRAQPTKASGLTQPKSVALWVRTAPPYILGSPTINFRWGLNLTIDVLIDGCARSAQQGISRALNEKKPAKVDDDKWEEMQAQACATITLCLSIRSCTMSWIRHRRKKFGTSSSCKSNLCPRR